MKPRNPKRAALIRELAKADDAPPVSAADLMAKPALHVHEVGLLLGIPPASIDMMVQSAGSPVNQSVAPKLEFFQIGKRRFTSQALLAEWLRALEAWQRANA